MAKLPAKAAATAPLHRFDQRMTENSSGLMWIKVKMPQGRYEEMDKEVYRRAPADLTLAFQPCASCKPLPVARYFSGSVDR